MRLVIWLFRNYEKNKRQYKLSQLLIRNKDISIYKAVEHATKIKK